MTRLIRHRRASTSIALICTLALVPLAPLRAEGTKDDEPSKTDKLLTQVTALTTTIEGLREKGAGTVKEHGGELEGALLSSFAIKAAAAQIRKENTGTGYLVASPSDAISIARRPSDVARCTRKGPTRPETGWTTRRVTTSSATTRWCRRPRGARTTPPAPPRWLLRRYGCWLRAGRPRR